MPVPPWDKVELGATDILTAKPRDGLTLEESGYLPRPVKSRHRAEPWNAARGWT